MKMSFNLCDFIWNVLYFVCTVVVSMPPSKLTGFPLYNIYR